MLGHEQSRPVWTQLRTVEGWLYAHCLPSHRTILPQMGGGAVSSGTGKAWAVQEQSPGLLAMKEISFGSIKIFWVKWPTMGSKDLAVMYKFSITDAQGISDKMEVSSTDTRIGDLHHQALCRRLMDRYCRQLQKQTRPIGLKRTTWQWELKLLQDRYHISWNDHPYLNKHAPDFWIWLDISQPILIPSQWYVQTL